jgi:8-oxo-dGTP diphosphatase
VLCSHGPVIPELIDLVVGSVDRTEAGATVHPISSLSTGDYTVLHISRKHAQLVASETHKPPV